jgi:hypothetical protein
MTVHTTHTTVICHFSTLQQHIGANRAMNHIAPRSDHEFGLEVTNKKSSVIQSRPIECGSTNTVTAYSDAPMYKHPIKMQILSSGVSSGQHSPVLLHW